MAQQPFNVGTDTNNGGIIRLAAFKKLRANVTDAESRFQALEAATVQSVSGVNEAHALTDVLIICDTSSNDVEIALLPAASWAGKVLNIKKTPAANNVILSPDSAETIDGAVSFNLVGLNEAATIISDGANIIIL